MVKSREGTPVSEISHPDFPGERLVLCRNPARAAERARKRDDLLATTEAELQELKALAHNELSATRGLELEASAKAARVSLFEARQAMTAGLAPEDIRAMDAARDAQLEHARAIEVARSELVARQARQLQRGWDRGRDRDGPGFGL